MTFVRRLSSSAAVLLVLVSPASSLLVRAQSVAVPAGADTMQFADGIAAIAEDKVITVDDIRREVRPLVRQIQQESRNEKEFNAKLEALQNDIVQNLIDRVLIVKEFNKDEKRRIPQSYVDNQMAEIIIKEFDNDRSKFLSYLRGRGKTIRDYRKEVEEDIIYSYMRQQQRKSQSVVSPVKVQTFYDEHKDQFYQEDSVHLRLIQFRRVEGETDAQLLAKANAVLQRFKNGEKFEDLAKEASQDMKRTKGGDWGPQKRSDLKPELSDPLFKLQKGQSTEPIIMPEGAFLLYVEDRKVAGTQAIDEVRDQIERILIQQMTRSNQDRWLERLRRNGYVKYY